MKASTMTFEQKLSERIEQTGSNLCVGLDPRAEEISGSLDDFLHQVVDETHTFAAAYKPNAAYFEAYGSEGFTALEKLVREIPDEVPVIFDCKRSDIPETQKYYAKAYFENWDVDAVTLNPLLGFDSIEPFLGYPGKGVYLLGITSNPGASEFLLQDSAGSPLFKKIADMRNQAKEYPASVGLVAGLTNIDADILLALEGIPLLVPGFGAQGGQLDALKSLAKGAPLLINASRSILYGPEGSFRSRAEASVSRIRQAIHGGE